MQKNTEWYKKYIVDTTNLTKAEEIIKKTGADNIYNYLLNKNNFNINCDELKDITYTHYLYYRSVTDKTFSLHKHTRMDIERNVLGESYKYQLAINVAHSFIEMASLTTATPQTILYLAYALYLSKIINIKSTIELNILGSHILMINTFEINHIDAFIINHGFLLSDSAWFKVIKSKYNDSYDVELFKKKCKQVGNITMYASGTQTIKYVGEEFYSVNLMFNALVYGINKKLRGFNDTLEYGFYPATLFCKIYNYPLLRYYLLNRADNPVIHTFIKYMNFYINVNVQERVKTMGHFYLFNNKDKNNNIEPIIDRSLINPNAPINLSLYSNNRDLIHDWKYDCNIGMFHNDIIDKISIFQVTDMNADPKYDNGIIRIIREWIKYSNIICDSLKLCTKNTLTEIISAIKIIFEEAKKYIELQELNYINSNPDAKNNILYIKNYQNKVIQCGFNTNYLKTNDAYKKIYNLNGESIHEYSEEDIKNIKDKCITRYQTQIDIENDVYYYIYVFGFIEPRLTADNTRCEVYLNDIGIYDNYICIWPRLLYISTSCSIISDIHQLFHIDTHFNGFAVN